MRRTVTLLVALVAILLLQAQARAQEATAPDLEQIVSDIATDLKEDFGTGDCDASRARGVCRQWASRLAEVLQIRQELIFNRPQPCGLYLRRPANARVFDAERPLARVVARMRRLLPKVRDRRVRQRLASRLKNLGTPRRAAHC